MSFQSSKKNLIKVSASGSNSCDKAANPALNAQPSSHGVRFPKSFFSFKPTTKRSLFRPTVSHEPTEIPNSIVHFPLIDAKNDSNQVPSTNSPPASTLPTRTLRSSVLFSQQFDLKHLSSSDESIPRDPSSTNPLADSTSRPLRSATRPSSWMMLKDASYAPSSNAQVQRPSPSDQHSPESFYNRSPIGVPQRVESSDDDSSPHASAATWNRLPSVPQSQQHSHLKGILAGYQLQIQTQEKPPPISVPTHTQTQTVSRSASKPAGLLTPNVPSAPAVPPITSGYSPLAAFLGQSKSTSPVTPKDAPHPSSTTPGGFLSAFLGSPLPEHPVKNPTLSPLSSVSPVPQISSDCASESRSVEKSARLEEPIRLDSPARVGPTSVKETSISPIPHSSPPSRTIGQLASTKPKIIHAIDATEADRSSARKQQEFDPLPSSVMPSCSTVTLAPSIPSSPRSTASYTPSQPRASVVKKRQKSIGRDRSSSDSGACDMKKLGSFQKCASRKRSVEKVYLDSSSQHSSICSDNASSVDDATRKRANDSDLSGAFTAPSSASSKSSPAPEKTLELVKDQLEVNVDQTEEVKIVQEGDSGPGQVKRLKNALTAVKKNTTHDVSDNAEEEAESLDDTSHRRTINFEHLLLRHPDILRRVISRLDYLDFFSLSHITNDFLEELEGDTRLREIVLQRYLTGFGYRTCPTKFTGGHRKRELPMITLDDLANLYAGLEFESLELIKYAKQALNHRGLDPRTATMIRSSTRSHNKLVAYIRAVEELSPRPGGQNFPPHRHAGRLFEPIYRLGKAPVLKVWVPSVDHWMSNEELAECERELWRSQIWSYLRKGDVCWNLAVGDFANEGKLIFDGRFLRDLSFDFDEVGHLPSWLDMLAFPPSYYHKVISSSTSTPIFYLDLSNYKDKIRKNLKLSEDKVEVASPQARYRVQRWVYRSVITIPSGDWAGSVVIEVEGTSEQAKDLLKRCCSSGIKNLTPWRIIREKSRPGKLWIRPVNEEERIN